MGFRRRSTPPAPPPPPPPPALPALNKDVLLQAAGCAVALAVLLQLLVFARLRSHKPSVGRRPLVSLASEPRRADAPVAFVTMGETELGLHSRRLLAERGYAVSYSAGADVPADGVPAVVVHLASQAEGVLGPARTTAAVAAQCERLSPPPRLVLVSDARAGCDVSRDVSDGDVEMEVSSHADPRLEALLFAEERLERFANSTGKDAICLRPHRLYGDSPPIGLAGFLFSGGGALMAASRAYTTLTHVENAALAVGRAADEMMSTTRVSYADVARGGMANPTVHTRIVTDGSIFSASYLLGCAACVMRCPPAVLPLLTTVLSPVVRLAVPTLGLAFGTHQYFDCSAPSDPAAAPPAIALRHALAGWAATAGVGARLIGPLYAVAVACIAAVAMPPTDLPTAPWLVEAGPALLLSAAALFLIHALMPARASLPAQGKLMPPVIEGGVPILGRGIDFARGPVFLITRLRSQYRSLFTMRIAGQRITFMQGPEAQRSFIRATDKELDQGPVYKFTIPVFGRKIVYDSPLEERQQQIKMVVHSMNTRSLDAMVPKIISEAEAYFATEWADEGEVDLRETFSGLIILTASATLMGPEIRANLVQEVARIYHALDNGLTPFSVFFPRAPTKAHKARDAARKEMVGIFAKVIQSRREASARGERHDDFLQVMIDFRYKDTVDRATGKVLKTGTGYTDDEITGLLIVLLFAGQHTSSITSAWLGAMILSHPEELAKLQQEQRATFGPGDKLNYESLLKMDGMRRAISETLRLYPPLILLIRKVMVERDVGQFTIPKGDIVMMCMPAGNKDPRFWSQAEEFRPDRFAPGSPEADTWSSKTVEHGVDTGKMLSFGGGHHMCSGRRFGFLQVVSDPPAPRHRRI